MPAPIRKLDITTFFEPKLKSLLEQAFHDAYRTGNSQVTDMQFLLLLLSDLKIQSIISNPQVVSNLQSFIISQPSEISADGSFGGNVFISPELQHIFLVAFQGVRGSQKKEVKLEDLLIAYSQNTKYIDLFQQVDFDAIQVSQKIEKEKGFFSDNLQTKTPVLDKYTKDMTDLASRGSYTVVIDREKELSQISRILARQTQNNVLLVGDQGVGKRTIVHGLAMNISKGTVPMALRSVRLLELDLPIVESVATSQERLFEFIEAIRAEFRENSKLLIFIEGFDSLLNIEKPSALAAIGSLLRPSITAGEIRIVATISSELYRKYVETDDSLAKMFDIVRVDEPNEELAELMVKASGERLAHFHGVSMSGDAVRSSVFLSKRYIPEKKLPQKAIDLLDEACSKASLERRDEVTQEDVNLILSEKTGIPIQKITESEQSKLVNLEAIIAQKLVGQDHAIKIVSESIRRSRAGLKDPHKPIGSFLFLGPTGVGKTELAKVLTKVVYDDENAMIRLDMSEFSEQHTVQRLVGAPPGYVGYEEGGQLTNPIYERPYSLILLDEIEKAHPKVFDIFLQVLDDGRLTDGKGRTVDFRNTIIIATSNIASMQISQLMEGADRTSDARETLMPVLMQYLRPEFINRFDAVIAFNPLSLEVMRVIADVNLRKLQKKLAERGIDFTYSGMSINKIAEESYDPEMGARPLLRYLQQNVENQIAKEIIEGKREGQTQINLDILLEQKDGTAVNAESTIEQPI